ncbi:MAG: rhodanese-like domain-containing protein [Planctomycetes bacterium]|nr:rhodanese-like domain-containing protein [Planctomycetota bacterium]
MKTKKHLLYLSVFSAAALFASVISFSNISSVMSNAKELLAGTIKSQAETAVKNVSPKEAKELIGSENEVFLLDVRTKEEYNESHIKTAQHLPVQELEQNIDKIPKDRKVVVYCASGKRSARACEILKNKGLKALYNIEGGIRQWIADGYPVETH